MSALRGSFAVYQPVPLIPTADFLPQIRFISSYFIGIVSLHEIISSQASHLDLSGCLSLPATG